MSKRGFLALMGAMILTLAVMIGAWSYSMATVVSEGTLRITSSPDALIGIQAFGVTPLVTAQRADTKEERFAIAVRTANPVLLSTSIRRVDERLGALLTIDHATDECVVQISPLGLPSFPVGMYLIEATIIAQGSGFRAAVDVDVPVEVLNSPIIANDDFATTSTGVAIVIPVLVNDSHPDGGMTISAVDGTGTEGSVTITVAGDAIEFVPKDGYTGDTTFTYTILNEYGGVTESDTATVTVTITE